jgi:hypothetical protein
MFRKIALGLFAAASLTAAALAPTAASAGGGWGPGWGGGWHHPHHFYGPALGVGYIGAAIAESNDCYVTRRVQTRHGWRLRTINVCY